MDSILISMVKGCEVCFFRQNNRCIIYKRKFIACGFFIRKIYGIDDVKSYLDLLNSRHFSQKALIISSLSLVVSFFMLVFKMFESK